MQSRRCNYRLALLLFFLVFTCISRAEIWIEHLSNIVAFGSRLKLIEGKLTLLVKERKSTSDAKARHQIMKRITQNYKELLEAHKNYVAEQRHMRFRHPEKGEEFAAKYYKVRTIKSIEELEVELGLHGQLNRMIEKIEKHYGVLPGRADDEVTINRKAKKGEEKDRVLLVK